MSDKRDCSIDGVEKMYDKYVEQFPELNLIDIGGPTGLPLKDAVSVKSGTVVLLNESELDSKCMLTSSETNLEIEDLSDEAIFQLPKNLTNIQKVQITSDHYGFWRYTLECAYEHNFSEFPITEEVIKQY